MKLNSKPYILLKKRIFSILRIVKPPRSCGLRDPKSSPKQNCLAIPEAITTNIIKYGQKFRNEIFEPWPAKWSRLYFLFVLSWRKERLRFQVKFGESWCVKYDTVIPRYPRSQISHMFNVISQKVVSLTKW